VACIISTATTFSSRIRFWRRSTVALQTSPDHRVSPAAVRHLTTLQSLNSMAIRAAKAKLFFLPEHDV
jgi:hypothetical protein